MYIIPLVPLCHMFCNEDAGHWGGGFFGGGSIGFGAKFGGALNATGAFQSLQSAAVPWNYIGEAKVWGLGFDCIQELDGKQMCWVFPLWLPLMNLGLEYLDTLVSHRPLISFDGFVILTPTVSQNVAKRCHILMPLPFRCQGGLAGFAWEGGKVIRWSSGRSGWCDTEQQGKRRIQDAKVVLAALFWLEWLKNEHVNVYVVYVLRLCYVCSV